MASFMQLISEWEIQLLVLLSFTLQIFLFFSGNLRRYNKNTYLRTPIWLAYLGADLVAVFALSFLLRHEDELQSTHLLAFFWAPFLLIHLGGQDTITAFAIEDNNLWLRHLLTLVMQVVWALYVFWKWIGRHNIHLLAPGILLFVSGIIKYGERTLALMYGSLKNTRHYIGAVKEDELVEIDHHGYPGIVRCALLSMFSVREYFAGSTYIQITCDSRYDQPRRWKQEDEDDYPLQLRNSLGVQLGMMYDDLYTKSMVLRTRNGSIRRCISQISAIIALLLFFLARNKQRYNRVDVAITYLLFLGGLFLDICAMLILMKSPWTWAWLKARRCECLADMSWFLFSGNLGWTESNLWSNSMGQYTFLNSPEGSDQPTRSCKQNMWFMVRKTMNFVGIKKKQLFWIRSMLDTKYVNVDEGVMDSVLLGISLLFREIRCQEPGNPVQWPKLGTFTEHLQAAINMGFATALMDLHIVTEFHLRNYPTPEMEAAPETITVKYMLGMVDFCRKISKYMMHLLATHPDMLPVTGDSVDVFLQVSDRKELDDYVHELQPCHDTLEGIRDTWILFLAYAAGKSRPEVHAAHLSKGGELITFVWLFMTHHGFGDSGFCRIELTSDTTTRYFPLLEHYFYLYGRSSSLPAER